MTYDWVAAVPATTVVDAGVFVIVRLATTTVVVAEATEGLGFAVVLESVAVFVYTAGVVAFGTV